MTPAEREALRERSRRYRERHRDDPEYREKRRAYALAAYYRTKADPERYQRYLKGFREAQRARHAANPERRRPMGAAATRRYYVRHLCELPAVRRRAEQVARGEITVGAWDLPSVLHAAAVTVSTFVAPSEQRKVPDPARLALTRWRSTIRRWALLMGVPLAELRAAGLWPLEPPGEPVDAWTRSDRSAIAGQHWRDRAVNHDPAEPANHPAEPAGITGRSAAVRAARGRRPA